MSILSDSAIPRHTSPSAHIAPAQPPLPGASMRAWRALFGRERCQEMGSFLRGIGGLNRQLSAVDSDAFAVYIAGVVGAEPCDGSGDFFGVAESALRNSCLHIF